VNEAATVGFGDPAACSKHRDFILKRFDNWRSYYAMAVIELGETVAREIKAKP
jgi:hypothetical protein